jgi:hypothetical protein
MSTILDKLLKTKAELENQVRIEQEEEYKKQEEVRAAKQKEQNRILQEEQDNIVQWEVGELAEKIKSIIGNKITDNNFTLLLVCAMFLYFGRVNENTLLNKIESLVRKYPK